MAIAQQPTCFYTSVTTPNLVIHNGGGPLNPYQGRKDSTFDTTGIDRTKFSGDGKFTYAGTLGTFTGETLKHAHD